VIAAFVGTGPAGRRQAARSRVADEVMDRVRHAWLIAKRFRLDK
jgi:hypothetical protein